MIKVTTEGDKAIITVYHDAFQGKDLGIWHHEIDQLIEDLKQASVKLKAGLTDEKSVSLQDKVESLEERVAALEYSNMRKL